MIVDAHLDIAYNALRGRDVRLPAAHQNPDNDGIPSVGLPDLREGNVNLVFATLFCMPHSGDADCGYRSPAEAHAAAREQLAWYLEQERARELRIIRSEADLHGFLGKTGNPPPPVRPAAVLLLEGADPIRDPDDAADWYRAGIRIVGLAWKQTRYAGGTGHPGPLTADGVTMVRALDRLHMIHDVSHLAERSFWQLLELSSGPVMASHSNCRAIVPTDRHLSDEMIRALVARGGIIGINFYDRFLLPPEDYGSRRASLSDVVRHIRHICDLAGSANHVAIGTDMDGGISADRLPMEIRTSADLPRVADALAASGFDDIQVHSVLAGNWIMFLRSNLHLSQSVSPTRPDGPIYMPE